MEQSNKTDSKTSQSEVPILNGAEIQILTAFSLFQKACFEMSQQKGFWEDQKILNSAINAHVCEPEERERLLKALNDAFRGQKIALVHSEVSEALEGLRKDTPSDKLEGFTAEEEEMADAMIRIGDYSEQRKLRLGLAIVLKMRYNSGRPHKHGKGF